MKSVLIANRVQEELDAISSIVGRNYDVSSICSRDAIEGTLDEFDLVLLDHNFTDSSGIDFLMQIMKECYLPVLLITPEDDPQLAVEAMRVGAFNYIVKTAGYDKILNISINEAISKFNEREEMKQTIIDLRKKVAKLEAQLGIDTNSQKQNILEAVKLAVTKEKAPSVISEIISRFKRGDINLPSLPSIIVSFNKLIKAGANIVDVANLLKQDVGISTKLINVSNSAMYRGASENKNLEDAISRLGLSVTRQYVYTIANRSLYVTANKEYSKYLEELWSHSLACACAAQSTVELFNLQLKTDAFTGAILHDVGKLILLEIMGELALKEQAFKELNRNDIDRILGQLHGKFGAVLLKRWNFPAPYVAICQYHNQLNNADPITKELLVTSFANSLVKSLGFSFGSKCDADIHDEDSTRFLKITPEQIDTLSASVVEQVKSVQDALT